MRRFLGSGGGGGNHKKIDGSKTRNDSSSQPTKLDVNVISSAGLGNDLTKDNVDGDLVKGTNVVSFDESFPLLNTSRNSIGGRPEVVKDAMYSGFVDTKVGNGWKSRSLDSDKLINAKAEVKIPKASILDVHSRFGFSLYGYFVGYWRMVHGLSEPILLKKLMPHATLRKEDLSSVPIWVKFHDIPIVAFTADGLSVMATKLGNPIMLIRGDRVLKKDMVIVIPNVEDDGEVIHTVRVEYECEPPRCSVCMVFWHDDMLCPKRHVKKPKKQHTNHDGFHHTSSSYGTNVGSKVQFKPKKPIWQAVSKKNSTSSSGKKVVQDVVGSASDSPSNTPLVARINELESQMLEEKLVLLDEDGNSLKTSKSTLPSSSSVVSKKVDGLVNEDNDSEWKRLKKEREEAQQKRFLENLKQLYINLPFIEALAQMPKYAKFLKGLLTNKARLEEACTITMNERCSAVLLNKLPSKEKDPGSFTIPCDIGQLHIDNALADL
ncbi:reverse transcriptase domain-containing protein [Tanacetum coccineum]